MADEPTLGDDLLDSALAISLELKKPLKVTYHMLEMRQIRCAFKWGGKWHARKSKLRAEVEAMERG
jgi:hypothetical protein